MRLVGKDGRARKQEATPASESAGILKPIIGMVAVGLLVLTGAGFLIRHLVNKIAFEDAIVKERWSEVLEYDPQNTKAHENLAAAYLDESPPNFDAVFEHLNRASEAGPATPFQNTVKANAYAKRAGLTASENPNEALVEFNKAVSGNAEIELLNATRGKLASAFLERALDLCDKGENKAAVEQLQQAYTIDKMEVIRGNRPPSRTATGKLQSTHLHFGTAIQFEGKGAGQIPLRLGLLEFTSKREAFLNSPNVAGLETFCKDVEKFFVLAAGSDTDLFAAGRFAKGSESRGVIEAKGAFLENAEKWGVAKTQFVARMHDMSAAFTESDLTAAVKTWKLAERIFPNTTPASLSDKFKETLVRNFHDAMASDRSNAGRPLSLLDEVDQNQSIVELRSIVSQMQSAEELNSLLLDISNGEGWPGALKRHAADLVKRYKDNTDRNARPLIQLFHDTKPIIGDSVPRYLYGRTVVLLWQPNPKNEQSAERMLNFLRGQPNKSGLVYRGPAKMVESLREWLETDADTNGGEPSWLKNCHRLYVCGHIAPGEDSFRLRDKGNNVQRPDGPRLHLGAFFVNRIIAAVSPSHPRSGSTTDYALTGQLFTADGQHDLLIHDVLLGNSIAKRGHPAMPILAGTSGEIHPWYVVGQKASRTSSPFARAASRGAWPDPYLQRLATADVKILQRESRKAAEVTSALFASGGVIGRDYRDQKLTIQQKSNLRRGKRLLAAVNAITDGTASWLPDLNEYKNAFSALAGEAGEKEAAKSLAQQWIGVTTPTNVAIVSLEDVIPLANKLVAEHQDELDAAEKSSDASAGAKESSGDGQPNSGRENLRYWPNETFQEMTSGNTPASQLYAKVLNETVFAMFDREKRFAESRKNASKGGGSSNAGDAVRQRMARLAESRKNASQGGGSFNAGDAVRQRMAKQNQEDARRRLGLDGGSSRMFPKSGRIVYYVVVIPTLEDLAAGRGSREKTISQAEYFKLKKYSKSKLLSRGYSRVGGKVR